MAQPNPWNNNKPGINPGAYRSQKDSNIMSTTLATGEHEFFLPDGRKLHLYVHTCDECTSLDVWTTRGREVEEVSINTGDTTRAPVGLMPWINGQRVRVPGPAVDGSHGWPAVATATLVWHDEKE